MHMWQFVTRAAHKARSIQKSNENATSTHNSCSDAQSHSCYHSIYGPMCCPRCLFVCQSVVLEATIPHLCSDWSRMGWGTYLWPPGEDQELPRDEGSRISGFACWVASLWVEGLQTCHIEGKGSYISLYIRNRALHPARWRTFSTFKWDYIQVRNTVIFWASPNLCADTSKKFYLQFLRQISIINMSVYLLPTIQYLLQYWTTQSGFLSLKGQ